MNSNKVIDTAAVKLMNLVVDAAYNRGPAVNEYGETLDVVGPGDFAYVRSILTGMLAELGVKVEEEATEDATKN
jgi:hypothetical protein